MAPVLILSLAAVEELAQAWTPRRTSSVSDFLADVVGVIGDVLKQCKTVRRMEFKCVVNSKSKLIGYSSINIKGVDGKIIGAGIIFQDITDF